MKKIIVFACVFLAALGSSVQAQTVMTVDAPRSVMVGVPFTLVFSVNAADPYFMPPELDAFTILAGPTPSISRSSTDFAFLLEAKQEGWITIGSGWVIVAGETIKNAPILIEGIRATAVAPVQTVYVPPPPSVAPPLPHLIDTQRVLPAAATPVPPAPVPPVSVTPILHEISMVSEVPVLPDSTRSQPEGIDIILAMDISTSMLAEDFTPDRIGASKDMAVQFIAGRPSDRIGVVVFAGEGYTHHPLTSDRAALIHLMDDIQTGILEDGTAIGEGVAIAVAHLKESNSERKVIILLTDGLNNKGEVAPLTAAEIAGMYGIKVYTVGMGAKGMAAYPVYAEERVSMQQMQVTVDEDLLQQMARITGGAYFRAVNNKSLWDIFHEISRMEESESAQITPVWALQILDAIQKKEQETQEKVDREKAKKI